MKLYYNNQYLSWTELKLKIEIEIEKWGVCRSLCYIICKSVNRKKILFYFFFIHACSDIIARFYQPIHLCNEFNAQWILFCCGIVPLRIYIVFLCLITLSDKLFIHHINLIIAGCFTLVTLCQTNVNNYQFECMKLSKLVL